MFRRGGRKEKKLHVGVFVWVCLDISCVTEPRYTLTLRDKRFGRDGGTHSVFLGKTTASSIGW